MTNRLKRLLLLGLAGFIALFLWLFLKSSPGPIFSTNNVPAKARNVSPDLVYYGPRDSIAVLAFQPLREGRAEAWLTHGMAVELADLLLPVPGLRVSAPTSALFFDSATGHIQGIAQKLQVSWLLLGDIALDQGALEIQLRLVESRSAQVAWSKAFAATLDSVPEVLIEMASGVRETIKPGGVIRAVVTARGEAWQAYHQGRIQLDRGDLGSAKAAFLAAVEQDPSYADAWLGLAQAHLADFPARVSEAELAIARALEANPDSARAYGWRSFINRNIHWNWVAALEDAERALRLGPGDAWLMKRAAQAKISLGQFAGAARLFRQSVARDPANLGTRIGLGLSQEFDEKYDEALKTYRLLLGMNAEFPGAHALRARIKVLQDNAPSALRESEQEADGFWRLYARALALMASGQQAQAREALTALIEDGRDAAAYQAAEINALGGNADAAFEWLQVALEQRDGDLREVVGNAFFRPLYDDPRWRLMITELGLPLDVEGVNH